MGIRFREVARAIEQVGPQTLLVMGCGNGYLESILSPAICTVSVDIDEEDLAVARALNKDKANRDFRLLDLYDLPQVVTAASFEAVVISEVLEHLEDDVKALEVAHYCLASEGTLFLSVPNVRRFQNRPRYILGLKPSYMARDHRREYTLDSILELVRRTGFRCVSMVYDYVSS